MCLSGLMPSLVGQQSSCHSLSLLCMSRSIRTIPLVRSCRSISRNSIQLCMHFDNTQTPPHKGTASWTRSVHKLYTRHFLYLFTSLNKHNVTYLRPRYQLNKKKTQSRHIQNVPVPPVKVKYMASLSPGLGGVRVPGYE